MNDQIKKLIERCEERASKETMKVLNQDGYYDVMHEKMFELIAQDLDAEILLSDSIGDWQGDWLAVLKTEGKQVGFVSLGYGSCGLCDPLEDATPDERLGIYEVTKRSIHWESDLKSLLEYINKKKEDCSYFWCNENGYNEFEEELIELANKGEQQ